MLIQHEETGRISEIADDATIPRRWHRIPEAVRVPGAKPDLVGDPIGWRKWWLACNPGKSWSDAGAAWHKAVA